MSDEVFEQIFNTVCHQYFDNAPDNTLIGIEVCHPSLNCPVLLPFMPKEKLQSQWVLALLYKVMQSAEDLHVNNELMISFTAVLVPQKGSS